MLIITRNNKSLSALNFDCFQNTDKAVAWNISVYHRLLRVNYGEIQQVKDRKHHVFDRFC